MHLQQWCTAQVAQSNVKYCVQFAQASAVLRIVLQVEEVALPLSALLELQQILAWRQRMYGSTELAAAAGPTAVAAAAGKPNVNRHDRQQQQQQGQVQSQQQQQQGQQQQDQERTPAKRTKPHTGAVAAAAAAAAAAGASTGWPAANRASSSRLSTALLDYLCSRLPKLSTLRLAYNSVVTVR
jgi:hypothetical protein